MDTDLNVAYIRYPPTTANEPPDGPCHVCDEYGSCHTCNSHAHTCFIKPAGGPKGTKEEDRSARGGGMSQSQQDTTAASQHSEVDNAKGVGGSIYKIEESEVGSKMSLSQDSSTERGNWQTKWDYFLSVAGFSIGLANVWRFPYLCYMNGGGAFLVPYLLVLVVVGLPLYLLESALGQFSSCSCFTLYEVCPIFKGVGYATFIMNLVFVAVYSVVIAYPLVFLYNSFSTKLPWSSCGNTWNTPACSLAENRNSTLAGDSQQLSPADEFFHNFILEISDDITELDGFLWPVVGASFFIWTFVFLTVFKGINVFGKVVWFTAIFPFIMLFTLLIRGLTLPGAWDGIYFYIWPNFEKLKELKIAHIETTTVSFVDEFPQYRHRRGLVTFLVCFFDMLASLLFCTRGGIYWLTLVDWYSASYTLILNCLCEILIFGLIYGAGRTVRDLQIMTTEKVSYYWYVVWLAAAPTVLLLIFINTMVSNAPASYRGEAFPGWAQGIGWLTALVSMLAIPIYFFYYLTCASSGSLSQRMECGLQPAESWGPAVESHREEWETLCKQQPLRHRLLHPDLFPTFPNYNLTESSRAFSKPQDRDFSLNNYSSNITQV
ncbi:sodium- and chloride-dependent glycine transporter 2-like isoform X3 [Homarus americanus]|uniref:sodium- and chloride-dependent glycine transporter 2-like isoform X3 n=1 Tax=Homarus americanus TaxID=6706 RepID=UPI001C44018A|nr:sodium- and chloride-dependent glycine transporter 2-like isoform X3 [Homarus americanus]